MTNEPQKANEDFKLLLAQAIDEMNYIIFSSWADLGTKGDVKKRPLTAQLNPQLAEWLGKEIFSYSSTRRKK